MDQMTFPDYFNFMDFIKKYSFNDKEEIYTNGADLIPVFRVEQAWDHYSSCIENAVNNIRECNQIIQNNLYDLEDII